MTQMIASAIVGFCFWLCVWTWLRDHRALVYTQRLGIDPPDNLERRYKRSRIYALVTAALLVLVVFI